MSADPKRIVEEGYDAIADRFSEWKAKIRGSPRMRYLDAVLERVPPGSDLLELGCGSGVASSRLLAQRGRLTCVDISREQLLRARHEVAAARLLHADLADVQLRPGSFDAVFAFYVLNHLPQADQRRLPARIFGWLRPGGYFVASYAASEPHERVVEGWLGAPMFFASVGVEENRTLLVGAASTSSRTRS